MGDAEASLAELRLAVAIRPEWDRPRVEIAIVLANEGRHAEALDVVRIAERELAKVTPWVRVHVAFVLEQLDRFEEAVAAYEAHVEQAPLDGEALDRLAHLLLARGDKLAGRERAKQARECGVGTVFEALEAGFYAKGADSHRRPSHREGTNVHFQPVRDRT
jgi:tetratricopeptide (TPR) repeat protein